MSDVTTESALERLPVADNVEPGVDASKDSTSAEICSAASVDEDSTSKQPDMTSGEDHATANVDAQNEV